MKNEHFKIDYSSMQYRRCGNSGLLLPMITLGLWHNFGTEAEEQHMNAIIKTALDLGIVSFDLANNYGPQPGAAEENFGRIWAKNFASHRDEIIVTTKAGHLMWDGPYGDWGSRKHLISSINQSLKRLQLDYVDIFYSHRPDPQTPLEETMRALADIVQQGKALYIGLSKYSPCEFDKACAILKDMGRIPIIYQGRASILSQESHTAILPTVESQGCGYVAFSPLAQGLLSNKYLKGIPEDSRAASGSPFLQKEGITPEKVAIIQQLHQLAQERGQSLAQMAISWLLSDQRVCSVVTGVSRPSQLIDSAQALAKLSFTKQENEIIEECRNHYLGL